MDSICAEHLAGDGYEQRDETFLDGTEELWDKGLGRTQLFSDWLKFSVTWISLSGSYERGKGKKAHKSLKALLNQ